jgi:hypothetical protein
MDCTTVTAHAADYLAGTLTDDEREAVRAHAATCAACHHELAALDDTWQLLGAVAPPRADSAAMRARFDAVLDAISDTTDGRAATTPPGALATATPRDPATLRFGHPATSWVWQGLATAAVLVIGIAIGRYAPLREGGTTATPVSELAALRGELADMREMVALSLLQQQSASDRLQGVAFSGRLEQPGSEVVTALLDTLLDDPNVNVRLAAVEALRRFADRAEVRRGTVAALPRQTSPLVQMALIDFVAESAGTEPVSALPADWPAMLRTVASDTMAEDAVRQRATQVLQQLGGRS